MESFGKCLEEWLTPRMRQEVQDMVQMGEVLAADVFKASWAQQQDLGGFRHHECARSRNDGKGSMKSKSRSRPKRNTGAKRL